MGEQYRLGKVMQPLYSVLCKTLILETTCTPANEIILFTYFWMSKVKFISLIYVII